MKLTLRKTTVNCEITCREEQHQSSYTRENGKLWNCIQGRRLKGHELWVCHNTFYFELRPQATLKTMAVNYVMTRRGSNYVSAVCETVKTSPHTRLQWSGTATLVKALLPVQPYPNRKPSCLGNEGELTQTLVLRAARLCRMTRKYFHFLFQTGACAETWF